MAGTYRHKGSRSATLRHAQVGDLVGDKTFMESWEAWTLRGYFARSFSSFSNWASEYGVPRKSQARSPFAQIGAAALPS